MNDFTSSPSVQQGVTKNGTPPEKAPPKECTCLPKVRIYYGTRTHKQIGQVVKEFSRLPYGGLVLHTILASREQSCINVAARESRDVSAYCKELLSAGGIGCRYKDAMKGRFDRAPNLRHVLERTDSVVFDMEELVESLSSLPSPLCPYFSSTRVLTTDADIIFCPFSYLVDPIIRNSSDVHLKHSVVILDEAHNIEDTCREAASFTFYEKEISDSLVNLREKENTTLKLIEKSSAAVDLMDGMEKEAANAYIEAYSLELERITALALLVDDIFKWFRDSSQKLLQYARKDDSRLSYTVHHGYLEVDLKRFHLHPDDERYQIVEPAYKGLVASYQEPKDNRPVDNRVGSVALICVEKWLYFIGYFKDENKRSMYKLNVCSEKVYQFHERGSYIQGDGRRDGQSVKNIGYSQMTGEESDVWLSSTQGPGGHDPIRSGYRTSFNLWCMCPELAFTDAFSECRSIILASGTLCPVETLKTELGLKFHSQVCSWKV
ncbi:DEAD2 domain protein [Ancylostoma caninum]|uniref:DEAD2 domain protein n=1 Tax=Ancylostoma caninum TaxID=29170 RepID=A0A368F5A1_ANCCA|nr:DEAD2 domain protein [Ancylostoma caninum]